MTTYIKFNNKTDLTRIAKLAWKMVKTAGETISEGFKSAWSMVTIVIEGVRYMRPVAPVKPAKVTKPANTRVALKNAEIVKETAGAVLVSVSVFANFSFYAETKLNLWFPKSQINLSDMTTSKFFADVKRTEIENQMNDGKVYGFSC